MNLLVIITNNFSVSLSHNYLLKSQFIEITHETEKTEKKKTLAEINRQFWLLKFRKGEIIDLEGDLFDGNFVRVK